MPTIRVNVDVDVGDVLDEVETKDLVRELRSRARDEGESLVAELTHGLSAWDAEKLREAVKNDDGRRVIDLLAPLMFPARLPTPDAFSKLARDPATGRPVIQ